MSTRDGTYMGKVQESARKAVSEVMPSGFFGATQTGAAHAAATGTAQAAQPATSLLPTKADLANTVDALKTWYASAFGLVQRYAHSHLFVAALCFLCVFLILIVANPPFVQQALPNQHELDNAPVSVRLVLTYSVFCVALLLGWPLIASWTPRAVSRLKD
jgi:hypothetical protein